MLAPDEEKKLFGTIYKLKMMPHTQKLDIALFYAYHILQIDMPGPQQQQEDDNDVDPGNPVGLGCALETFGEVELINDIINLIVGGCTDDLVLERSLESFITTIDHYQV